MKQRAGLAATAALLLVCSASTSSAYSVLTHEALIDDVWVDHITPLLKRRFPRSSPQAIEDARAYAYGGSLIQDLGYYPFGSRFFSNLVHYVRSGSFVETLIRESRSVNDYAFALGALAHYASDTAAHPVVNHALPMIYPKLRAKYGDEVLFSDSPARHAMVEFSFDVMQVARGRFKSDAYQNLIGFEVSRPLLERAFKETYGLELKDVFGDVGLAIGTYRKVASEIIPDVTRVAWREKRDEILAVAPDITEKDFVYSMTRQQYEDTYGTGYRKPGLLVRFVIAIFKVLPKFGPFRPLAFEPLSAETEHMFQASYTASREEYRRLLRTLRAGGLSLTDVDLDTGTRPARGVNDLADETYADLLSKLQGEGAAGLSPVVRRALATHYVGRYGPRSAASTPLSR